MKKKIILILFISLFMFGCGKESAVLYSNLPNHKLYYSYNDYNNNINSIYVVDIQTDKKETILNTKETISSLQTDSKKVYAIFTNRVGYVNGDNIQYVTNQDEYVARYRIKNNVLYYGKDNNNMSDEIYERFAMKDLSNDKITILSDYGISQLIVDDYVYFKLNSGEDVLNLFRLDLIGTNKRVINNENIGKLIKGGDYVYFINYSDNSSIYKIKTDGTSLKKIVEGPINFTSLIANPIDGKSNMGVIDDYLYYINSKDESKLYKTDGINSEVVVDESINSLYIKDDYIYCDYSNLSKNGIYLLNQDGKQLKKITNIDYYEYLVN